MFDFLKEKKIKKELNLANLQKDFDLTTSENYQLPAKETSPFSMNTYVFSAHSFEKRQTLYFKLTTTPVQTEAIVYVTEGFNKYVLEQQIYTTNCPLKIFKDEENIWNVSFSSYLKKNNKDNAKFTFTSKFEPSNVVVDKSTYYQNEALVKSFKFEKNYKEKINDLQNDNNVSYMQHGSLKGRMILEGQTSIFDIGCTQIHTYGNFDFSKTNNHIDILIADKDVQFNYQMLSQPNMTLFDNCSYCDIKNNQTLYLNKALYEKQLLTRGIAPSYMNILLYLNDEKELGLHIKKIDEIEMMLQEGAYKLIISIVEVLMGGKKYRGIMETGFNQNSAKWFNGNDVSEF